MFSFVILASANPPRTPWKTSGVPPRLGTIGLSCCRGRLEPAYNSRSGNLRLWANPPDYSTMTQQLFRMAALTLLVCAVIVPEVTSFASWSQEMVFCMDGCLERDNQCTEECQTDGLVDDCIQKQCVGGMRACRQFCNMMFVEQVTP
ncbi:hypothetical protein LSAT2_013770 [Lamellibrachia satsuma]|nr:hypothetical protein LSAT2_013770 [Lamellibrachia satsuma]